jgi:hypothetical protein
LSVAVLDGAFINAAIVDDADGILRTLQRGRLAEMTGVEGGLCHGDG